jgi:hypothetical protein
VVFSSPIPRIRGCLWMPFAKLEVFETETFPAEDVKVFWKALV